MIFDSHLHIIDAAHPLIPNHGFLPDPFSCDDYRAETETLDIVGGCVVSGSYQGFDQDYLKAALAALGPRYVGVAQLPMDVTDAEIQSLDAIGVRAVRFNLHRGGSISLDDMAALARRVYALVGWHAEMYIDSIALADRLRLFLGMPRLVIDHLGLSADGLHNLYKLVEHGVRVKASGFGRLNFDPAPVLQRIADINPDALMFGSDLPSTRAPRPFKPQDVVLLQESLAPDLARKALYENAIALYRPREM